MLKPEALKVFKSYFFIKSKIVRKVTKKCHLLFECPLTLLGKVRNFETIKKGGNWKVCKREKDKMYFTKCLTVGEKSAQSLGKKEKYGWLVLLVSFDTLFSWFNFKHRFPLLHAVGRLRSNTETANNKGSLFFTIWYILCLFCCYSVQNPRITKGNTCS